METMINAAYRALKELLFVGKGVKLLIVSDTHVKRIGEAFFEAGKKLEADQKIYFLNENTRPIKEIPAELLKLVQGINVGVNVFKGFSEETPFRISWIHEIMKHAKRLGHGPGITESMMKEGPMNVDFSILRNSAEKLINAFQDADKVHITAPAGTDLTLWIKGRRFMTDARIDEGHWGNIPCGETWCGPEEDKGDGILVCDGSIGDLGNVMNPLRITIRKGRIADIQSSDETLARKVKELTSVDDYASVLGELGIGLNPGARLTGNLLEDEKAFHTAHIAFGNNEDMPGGKNHSKTHRDFLFKDPTFRVTYSDGTERILIDKGNITVI
jgi:leucyl aminopeptidase (aminopeptidase T)